MLNKNNFEIAKLCPKKDENKYRYAWHGIRVTPTGTTVTEGHILIQVSGVGDTEEFDPFILPAKAASKIAAALPLRAAFPDLSNAVIKSAEAEKVVIEVTNADLDVESYSIRPAEGGFPDISKVIPAIGKATMELDLDLDLLVPLLERIRKFYGNQDRKKPKLRRVATFRFHKLNPDGPMKDQAQRIDAVNDQGQTLTAVIMPCQPGTMQTQAESSEARNALDVADG